MTAEQIQAHFSLMAQNFQFSLMIAAAITLVVAVLGKPIHALALGIATMSAITIYMNG